MEMDLRTLFWEREGGDFQTNLQIPFNCPAPSTNIIVASIRVAGSSTGVVQIVTHELIPGDVPPILTVVKHVINDDGGTATADQWTMNITGAIPPTGAVLFGADAEPAVETVYASPFH